MKKKTYIVIFVNPTLGGHISNELKNHSSAITLYKDYKTMIKRDKLERAWVKLMESDGYVRNHFSLIAQPWHF